MTTKNLLVELFVEELPPKALPKLGDAFVSIEVANGVELQLQRAAIIQVLPKGTYK